MNTTRFLAILFLPVLFATGARASEAASPNISWGQLVDGAASDPTLNAARDHLVRSAKDIVGQPVVRRAHKLGEVGQNRTRLDSRALALEDEIKEKYALAMSDYYATLALSTELPVLATAFRLTGEPVFRDRIHEQLSEMATWLPLQRPGWTLYTRGNRLPPDGNDGAWLATGYGIRAIGDCLDLMPEGSLDAARVEELHSLLEREVAAVVDDWATQRSWFIKSNNPATNQWVLPTEGLVRACLLLGVEENRDAYELGVRNLLMALDAHGRDGEFEEGFGYAIVTVTSMLHAAHAMAAFGDRRAIDHTFLSVFPSWLVQHLQPGDMTVNCFDAGPGYGAGERIRPLLSLFAALQDNPVVEWALFNQTAGPTADLAGLVARARTTGRMGPAPTPFANYERATRVNWRSSWDMDASGVWVRGGHRLDLHDHQDRGHVNFIWRSRPILIEAGTPDYGNKFMMTRYSSVVGHNVLQRGPGLSEKPSDPGALFVPSGWQKMGCVAPIAVARLEAGGGDVTVTGDRCYDGVPRWRRRVQWDADRLIVSDDVGLAEGTADFITFRWHLGSTEVVTITGEGNRYEVSWPEATALLESDAPVSVFQVKLPDNTLPGHTGMDDADNNHTCLVVQSAGPLASIRIDTRFQPRK